MRTTKALLALLPVLLLLFAGCESDGGDYYLMRAELTETIAPDGSAVTTVSARYNLQESASPVALPDEPDGWMLYNGDTLQVAGANLHSLSYPHRIDYTREQVFESYQNDGIPFRMRAKLVRPTLHGLPDDGLLARGDSLNLHWEAKGGVLNRTTLTVSSYPDPIESPRAGSEIQSCSIPTAGVAEDSIRVVFTVHNRYLHSISYRRIDHYVTEEHVVRLVEP